MAALMSIDSFPTEISAENSANTERGKHVDHITFGAVHLNNTNLKVATDFWTKIVGMKLRNSSHKLAEFGSESQTLVVIHENAKSSFKEGYSGLYHFAIHAPNKVEFARMIQRLIHHNYSFSPIDHTMSKSIYLRDPDSVLLEFTLETPYRFKRLISEHGIFIEDKDGLIRGASDVLDVNEQLQELTDKNIDCTLHADTKIGHIHFYVSHLDKTNDFYQSLGFDQFNYLSKYKYADVGAGGAYKHRIAVNSWHGVNQPLAPQGNAGLNYCNLIYESKSKLTEALTKVCTYEKKDNSYWLTDPSGNRLCLRSKADI